MVGTTTASVVVGTTTASVVVVGAAASAVTARVASAPFVGNPNPASFTGPTASLVVVVVVTSAVVVAVVTAAGVSELEEEGARVVVVASEVSVPRMGMAVLAAVTTASVVVSAAVVVATASEVVVVGVRSSETELKRALMYLSRWPIVAVLERGRRGEAGGEERPSAATGQETGGEGARQAGEGGASSDRVERRYEARRKSGQGNEGRRPQKWIGERAEGERSACGRVHSGVA